MFENRNIKSQFQISVPENIFLNVSKAISFGLLMSELISNSLKYGQSTNKIVEIYILIEKSGDTIVLEYSDQGKGLPENFDIKKSKGFGFKLILNLIKQLKAEYKISTNESFKFNLELKN
jgi:two-component sensor histidine kinase